MTSLFIRDPTADASSSLQEAIAIMDVIGTTKKFNLSCTVLYLYDFLTTYGCEITYIWTPGVNLGKVLYVSIRYFTLFVMLAINIVIFSPNVSQQMYVIYYFDFPRSSMIQFHFHMGIIICALVQLALQLRVYAMYNKDRRILYFCSTSLFCMFATGNIISYFSTKGADIEFVNLGPGSNMHSCAVLSASNWYKTYWAPKVFNESILFTLALRKGLQSFRLRIKGARTRLIDLLVRDSILYFSAVLIFYIIAWTVWITKGITYLEVPAGFAMAMEAIMSQKILIHIFEEFSQRMQGSEETDISTSVLRVQHSATMNGTYEIGEEIELRDSSAKSDGVGVLGTLANGASCTRV